MPTDSIQHRASTATGVGHAAGDGAASPGVDVGRDDLYARAFVWLIWAGMSLGLIAWIVKYGAGLPTCDDWVFVERLVGPWPPLAWLWEQVGYTRFFLGKVLMWPLWHASGGDVRAGMFFDAAGLILATMGLILAAQRLRGAASYTDAFLPMLLLNWYVTLSFTWFMLISWFAGVFLFYALLIFFAVGGEKWIGWSLGAAVCLALLPTVGALGILYAPLLVLAAVVAGIRQFRSGQSSGKVRGAVLIGGAAAAVALVAINFIGFVSQSLFNQSQGSIGDLAVRVLSCASLGLGGPRLPGWIPQWSLGAIAAILAVGGVLLLLRGKPWREKDFGRVACFVLAIGAAWAFAAAVGLGRGRTIGAPWYAIMAAPIWCGLYLLWCRAGSQTLQRLVQMGLFTLVCAMLLQHMAIGADHGIKRQEAFRDFQRDVASGIPLTGVVARNSNYWAWNKADDEMRNGLLALWASGEEPWASIQSDPPWKAVKLTVPGAEGDAHTPAKGQALVVRESSEVSVTLPGETFVYAIEMEFQAETSFDWTVAPTVPLEVVLPREGASCRWSEPEVIEQRCMLRAECAVAKRTVWVDRTIAGFCIRATRGRLPLCGVTLLVKGREAATQDAAETQGDLSENVAVGSETAE